MTKQKRGAAVAPKVLEAQHRNELTRRFKAFIAEQLSAEVAANFSEIDFKLLFLARTGGVRIIHVNEASVKKDETKAFQSKLVRWLRNKDYEFCPNKPTPNLYDILTLGIPLITLIMMHYEDVDNLTARLIPHFESKKAIEDLFKKEVAHIQYIGYLAGMMNSDYNDGFCYITLDFADNRNRDMASLAFFIHHLYPETRYFKIDDHSRAAYRLAWYSETNPITELAYYDITPAELCIDHPTPYKALKVFIQKHAIERMYERIDSLDSPILFYSAFASLKNPVTKVISSNKLIIEFRVQAVKLGYFVATIEEDALLIRTFLFITSNGTPEGDLLKMTTGLQVLDKKFLAIDKLSTFVSREVFENDEIRAIFERVGCGDLFSPSLQKVSINTFFDKHTPAVKLPSYISNDVEAEPMLEEEPQPKEQPIDVETKTEILERASLKQRTEQAMLNIARQVMHVLKLERHS